MHRLPYLLLNTDICKGNIDRMAKKAILHKLTLRPHFKTHQSAQIAEWFRELGISSCTVSSVKMTEYFANAGWSDITIAFPVSPFEVDAINALAKRISLNVIFSSASNLLKSVNLLTENIGVFIEVDVGHNRSGVDHENTREIALMVNQLEENPKLMFRGFITHAGHTYKAKSTDEVLKIHRESISILIKLKAFWKESHPDIIVSYGDTPSCSIADDFWGIDEIRPGNFVFYDVMQSQIGSCTTNDIAVAVICPVVDINHDRQEAVILCGAVHLSKDSINLPNGETTYGMVCAFDGNTWGKPLEELYVKSLSQEHGIIAYSGNFPFKVGDLLAILPIHSCLTVDLMGEVKLTDGSTIQTMRQHSY
ncbi:MAG: alanine racemase [Bacteroidales bacterium]|nr:alanine racemase [Bacteroidales bacterium]